MSEQLILQNEAYPAFKRSTEKNDCFEQMHKSTNWFSINYDKWHLPAIDEPKADCGRWKVKGCPNVKAHENCNHLESHKGKIFVKKLQKSCYRADCKICFKKWMARQANKATRRIEKYEKMTGESVKHIIVSVPSWDYYKPKKELAKMAYKILGDVKSKGGCIIFHPFRKQVVYLDNEIKFKW